MGQRGSYAAAKDVRILFKVEDFARGMGKNENNSAVKGGQINLRWGNVVCRMHGEIFILCSTDGSTNQVQVEASWGQ